LEQNLRTIPLPERFQLPLNPTVVAKGVIPEKCRCMDSAKAPLWLVFENEDPHGDPIYVIFKSGDDLRQDILTLQMLHIMDRVSPRNCSNLFYIPF
jgi:phosphatidylinositol kinase/protein kinase (PI-3  family)